MNSIAHLKSHLTKEYLERLSSIAFAASGFSAGLLVVLVQNSSALTYNKVSLWSAMFSLIVSLYGWRYFLTFLVHGERTYPLVCFKRVALIQVLVAGALLTSVTALVWAVSVLAARFLVVFSLLLTLLVFRHNLRILGKCEKNRA